MTGSKAERVDLAAAVQVPDVGCGLEMEGLLIVSCFCPGCPSAQRRDSCRDLDHRAFPPCLHKEGQGTWVYARWLPIPASLFTFFFTFSIVKSLQAFRRRLLLWFPLRRDKERKRRRRLLVHGSSCSLS
ncbi:hypothetical protein BDW66DRAFT_31498 [Aspergillus desertorum]